MPSASQEDTSYTQQGIMAQIWVAFGQGSGMTRASQKAVMALHARYFDHIASSGIQVVWGENAMQVLERYKALYALERVGVPDPISVTKQTVTDAVASNRRPGVSGSKPSPDAASAKKSPATKRQRASPVSSGPSGSRPSSGTRRS